MGYRFASGAGSSGAISPNLLINSDAAIDIAADGASVADAAYGGPTLWYALTQTGAIAHAVVTGAAAGVYSMHRITQSQASAQRMGLAHPLRSAHVMPCRSSALVLSGKIRCSASTPIRYAVVEWTGTADSITRDVVNSWTNATFTAGQFFISTTTNILGVGSITPAADTVTDITALAVTAGASANNLIVLCWTENTVAQNVTLDIRLKLEAGTAGTTWVKTDDTIPVEQFYQHYELNKGGGPTGQALTTITAIAGVRFRRPLWKAPTITLPAWGVGAGQATFLTAAGNGPAAGTVSAANVSAEAFEVNGSAMTAASLVAGMASVYYGQAAKIILDARL